MSKGRDRTVSRRSDGKWANKRNDADKASSLHDTQKEAEAVARQMLRDQGGGDFQAVAHRADQARARCSRHHLDVKQHVSSVDPDGNHPAHSTRTHRGEEWREPACARFAGSSHAPNLNVTGCGKKAYTWSSASPWWAGSTSPITSARFRRG